MFTRIKAALLALFVSPKRLSIDLLIDSIADKEFRKELIKELRPHINIPNWDVDRESQAVEAMIDSMSIVLLRRYMNVEGK